MQDDRNLLTRRKAIQGAASLLGGTIAATQLSTFMSRAAVAAAAGEPPEFFDADQFALVERIVDVMIPETDTPGAHAVGVHHFVDLMLAEWASPERQARYVRGLNQLDAELQGPDGDSFVDLAPDQQLEVLRAVDAAAYADDAGNPFFVELKKMVLFSFYSSEIGATEELQHEALPGQYRHCIPVDEDVRAWFDLGFSYGL
jgi:gluconate 2-dehydrogenase gamma chain